MSENEKIVIFGATGLIGKALIQFLKNKGYLIVIVSRHPELAVKKLPGLTSYLFLDFRNSEPLKRVMEGSKAVINLAGAPLFAHRLNEKYKQEIYSSRIDLTDYIVDLLVKTKQPPSVFLNASAIGYYGFNIETDEHLTESSPGEHDYQSQLTQAWEKATSPAAAMGMRVCQLRTGLLLSNEPAGALQRLSLPFKFGVGGPIGSLKSWRSWIHIEDEINAIHHIIQDSSLSGPVNLTAPFPVTNQVFAQTIGSVLGKPSWLPVPEWAMALLVGPAAEVITRGKYIEPTKLLGSGYHFKFPELKGALENLLKNHN